ncbi:MAG TPA: hypothetical protein ENI42_05955 [Thermoplasmatales archaeon]|nr:hypothetical protein [Thermoplasmatales archaeon]
MCRKLFSYLKFFGPGAILASMTIGAGNIVLAPRVGAWAVPAYSALWIITFAMVTKGLIAYMATRYSLLSGEHIMDLFSRIPPRGWINWVTIVISVVLLPFMIATFLTLLGNAMTLFTGVGNYFVWGIVVGLFIAFVGFFGSFKLLQSVQLVFALFLAAGAVVAVVIVNPDWLAMVFNLFSFRVPQVASWVTAEDVLSIPVLLQLAAVYGTMSGQYPDFIAYVAWWRNRVGRGRIKLSSDEMKGMRVDLFLSMLLVAVFTIAFMAAGVVILKGRHLLPNGIDLISAQQSIYDTINPVVGSYIYPVAVLVVIGGTVYAGMDALPRMVKATLDPISKRVRGWSFKRFQGVLVLYLTLTSLPLMLMEKPIVLMTLYLFINGVVGFALFGWGALWANQRHLPKEQRFGKNTFTILLASNVLLTVFIVLIFAVK